MPSPPDHVSRYYEDLATYALAGVSIESTTEHAFKALLTEEAKKHGWTLVKHSIRSAAGASIIPDGILKDEYNIPRGYWEAKDEDDDLDEEIARKRQRGYPLSNIVFEDTRRAVLYQNGVVAMDTDITDAANLTSLLAVVFSFEEAQVEGFHQAVATFRDQIPDLARGLRESIELRKAPTRNTRRR